MGGKGSGRKPGSRKKEIVWINGEPGKTCIGPGCNGKPALLVEFCKGNSYCKECNKQKRTTEREGNFFNYRYKQIIASVKRRAKKGITCEIDPNLKEFLKTMCDEQKFCYYSGVELMEKVNNPNSWSVDRVDFHAGYVPGNMVLCTTEINMAKGKIESAFDTVKKKLVPLYGEEKTLTIIKNILGVIK